MSGEAVPTTATCYVPLAAGKRLTVTATLQRVSDSNVERVKAGHTLHGHPAKGRLKDVLRAARLAAPVMDERGRVTCDISPPPSDGDHSWELAAVLADRIVRGLWHPPAGEIHAVGLSDDWLVGDLLAPADLAARLDWLPTTDGKVVCVVGASAAAVGEWSADQPSHWRFLDNIAALDGHTSAHRYLRVVSAWFPAVWDGTADQLIRVDVGVRPSACETESADDSVEVLGIERKHHSAIVAVLHAARRADPKGPGRWASVVRLASSAFQGKSWELALVLADRIARGREWPARGRVIASGTSENWAAGRVANVDGVVHKCALLGSCVQRGDRILLPAAWRTKIPPDFITAVTNKGGTVALIDSFLGV